MAEVKWIKINVDMFDDEKIKIIQSMPDGDALLIVWIKLITLAGKTNDGGYVYISENMPYTEEMLSVIMNKPLTTIRLAIDTFMKLGMIDNDIKGIYLLNFEKHQSLEKLEKLKEQNRKRVAKCREKKKLLECNGDVMLPVMQCNGIDIDKEEDKEEDKDIDIDIEENINNSNLNISSPSKSKDEEILKEEFDKLWKLYPKKVGKDKAFIKYKKYRTSKGNDYTTYDEVMKGLERYLKYIEQNIWYSPKDGSTWFNNKSWNDEYEIKEDRMPEWFNKNIEPKVATQEERDSIEKMLAEYR